MLFRNINSVILVKYGIQLIGIQNVDLILTDYRQFVSHVLIRKIHNIRINFNIILLKLIYKHAYLIPFFRLLSKSFQEYYHIEN